MREGENIILDRTIKTKENLETKTLNKTRGLVENLRRRQIIDIQQQQTVLHQRSVLQLTSRGSEISSSQSAVHKLERQNESTDQLSTAQNQGVFQ